MATILTKDQICALYGAKNNEELVAYGRVIKHTEPVAKLRRFTLDDFGTPEFEAYHDRLLKTPSKPAARVIESEVQELTS
jgi:hypothetical protein